MIIISHRGNLNGRTDRENEPMYITEAIQHYPVEVDVWYKHGWWLGHDIPQYNIKFDFFTDEMWLHCKNIEAVEQLKETNLHWFWHKDDIMTLTSKGKIWAFTGNKIKDSIMVDNEFPRSIDLIAGICTDYPDLWDEYLI